MGVGLGEVHYRGRGGKGREGLMGFNLSILSRLTVRTEGHTRIYIQARIQIKPI